ncbi:PepSY-like domain-containing protein [Parabacteroides sp. PF5-9]|uniref:PepSY-like domain-containing protein n=1 Tax=Parabacteroides sp. PF5-9 TaxID=1742404 RepID=UPI002472FCE8|nr:PepSY-like domain-containing protein [Parabacteroides sp. PF5-9]MDH6358578.1 hypothetical protein [Parabacteroides sp. PF5-9]
MKKISSLVIILFLSVFSAIADNDRITQDVSELPIESREFISTHFTQTEISHIKIEKNLIGIKNYDVILTDGTNIEFNRSGKWTDIDRRKQPIPTVLIPATIAAYVKTNFSDKQITSIERETREWSVKLDNGLELTFNKKGQLIEIDD